MFHVLCRTFPSLGSLRGMVGVCTMKLACVKQESRRRWTVFPSQLSHVSAEAIGPSIGPGLGGLLFSPNEEACACIARWRRYVAIKELAMACRWRMSRTVGNRSFHLRRPRPSLFGPVLFHLYFAQDSGQGPGGSTTWWRGPRSMRLRLFL